MPRHRYRYGFLFESFKGDALAVLAIFVAGVVGAAIFISMLGGENETAVREVEATALVSTGLVQGSENTLALYDFEGETHHVLATGGPYMADDTFTLWVNSEGAVVTLVSGFDIAAAAVLGFVLFAALGAMGLLFGVVILDP